MTSDAEIARNPHQPEGWRRNDIVFFVAPPPRCTQTSRRRRFANSTPSRSPQTWWYSWDETLAFLLVGSRGNGGIRGKFTDQADNRVAGNAFLLGLVLQCIQRLPG